MSEGLINRRVFQEGATIFHEGHTGAQAYVLQEGKVRITRNVKGGRKSTIGFINKGGIFGEMALIDQSPRMASAIAEEMCVCIVIPEHIFNKKLRSCSKDLRILINIMIRMIRNIADNSPFEEDDLKILDAASHSTDEA
jgi:CRP-like cAMP-binding protein